MAVFTVVYKPGTLPLEVSIKKEGYKVTKAFEELGKIHVPLKGEMTEPTMRPQPRQFIVAQLAARGIKKLDLITIKNDTGHEELDHFETEANAQAVEYHEEIEHSKVHETPVDPLRPDLTDKDEDTNQA